MSHTIISNSQLFDVGPLAVVQPWQFFAGTDIAFQTVEWEGALSSKCAAKELMQVGCVRDRRC